MVSVSVPSVCHRTKVEQFVCPFGLDSCAVSGKKSHLRQSGLRGKSDFKDPDGRYIKVLENIKIPWVYM